MDLHCTASHAPVRDAELRPVRALELPSTDKAQFAHPDADVRMAERDREEKALGALEAQIMELWGNINAAHVERTVRGFRRVKRHLERDEAEALHERRHLLCWRESDGSVTLNARLTPEVGELLFKALDAAQAQLEERSEESLKTEPPIPVDGSVSAETLARSPETPAQSPETPAPSPETLAQPAAPNNSRFSMRSAAWPSTPALRAAVGGANAWTTTSRSTRFAGRRAILDGQYKRSQTAIRIEPLPANKVSVKKYLPLFATLVLVGCAHSGYRTTYLEEYAGHGCVELRTERLAVEDGLGPKWVKGRSAGSTMSTALFFSDTVPPVPAAVAARMTPTIIDYPYATGNQKERMQMHAKWQALLELERNKGCAQAS